MKKCFLWLLPLCLLLTQCSTKPLQQPLLSANTYLQMAAVSRGNSRVKYQLLAAKRLLKDHKLNQAMNVLNSFNHANLLLPPALSNTLQLERAHYLLLTHRPHLALNALSTMPHPLPHTTTERYLSLLARIQSALNEPLAMLTTQDQLIQQQQGIEKHHSIQHVWASLLAMPTPTLRHLKQHATHARTQAWLQLALIVKTHTPLVQAIAQWQASYPNHPANWLVQKNSNATLTQPPQRIALLLPLTGTFGPAGNAIKNGYLAALYQSPHHAHIQFYNTNNKDITQVYRKAIQQGAQFIVGPLTKAHLRTLIKTTPIRIPTLALNNIQHTHHNLYQFGLSPAQDAQQLLAKAAQNNYRNAALIYPDNTWGQHLATRTIKQWQQLGGQVVSRVAFSDQASLSPSVARLLNVNQSYARIARLREVLNEKVRAVIRRRKDIDVIFMIANPAEARQIMPLLTFYFAGNLPVYAMSTAYQGSNNPPKNADLNGLMLDIMPWVLPSQLPGSLKILHQQIKATWPTALRNYPKLFALGIDAYHIVFALNRLKTFPHLGLSGASGHLSLGPHGTIQRRLLFAQIRYGRLEKIQ